MPTAAENLRARFKPEWKTRIDLAGLHPMLENALSFIAAPQAMKAEIEGPGTLNARGVLEALRNKLGRSVVPELGRILRVVNERKAALKQERAALTMPKIDPNDVSKTLLRQEARVFLRGLDLGERMGLLLQDPDETLLAAALEGPPELSGLTAQMRADVEQAYVKAHHAQTLRAMEDRQEALDVVGAAAEIAIMEVRNHVGMEPYEFDQWFATAANSDKARAA